MDGRLLVFVIVVLAVSKAVPIAQNSNQKFMPGLFISTQTLNELAQAQANQNQNPPITNAGRNVPGVSASSQNDDTKIGPAYQTSSPQNIPSQQTVLVQNQPQQVAPVVSNQPTVISQSLPQVITNQPNGQAILVSQPSNQPILVSQPANQPTQAILVNQPQQSGQTILVQQPGYNQQPLYINQPNNQLGNQPNQVLLSNGQIAQVVTLNNGQNGQPFVNSGQPVVFTNNNVQPGVRPLSAVQNPAGVQYAVLQNNVPNTNGNTYVMVPSTSNQQLYAVNG